MNSGPKSAEEKRSNIDLERLPKAKIEKSKVIWLFWLIPIAAAGFLAWLVWEHTFGSGPNIEIIFTDATGLEPGKSPVKYRGATIGIVKSIKLADDLKNVSASIRIDQNADKIAREGTEFWIVKPEVTAGEVRGLSTIVSGSYIGVKPGSGAEKTKFQAIPQPVQMSEKQGVAKFLLLSDQLHGIKEGAPVLYRGIKVGAVSTSELGPKSQLVEIIIEIEQPYVPLVRENSKFWNAGGVNVSLGFGGLDMSAESFKTLVGGGIAFSTPDVPGKEAAPATAFRLYEKADESWVRWAPDIHLNLPEPLKQLTSTKNEQQPPQP